MWDLVRNPGRPVFSQRGSFQEYCLQKGRTGEDFANRPDKERYLEKERKVSTVKFLNFQTPENFAVIYLKFRQRGHVLEYFVKKTHLE